MQLFTSQSISQRQSLVVTAQLQQAIQLLQMGNTDLASFIEGQAEENPFLDLGARSAQPRSTRDLTLPSQIRAGGDDDWDRLGQLAADPGPSLYAHASKRSNPRAGWGKISPISPPASSSPKMTRWRS